jgi:hypothetical protein
MWLSDEEEKWLNERVSGKKEERWLSGGGEVAQFRSRGGSEQEERCLSVRGRGSSEQEERWLRAGGEAAQC